MLKYMISDTKVIARKLFEIVEDVAYDVLRSIDKSKKTKVVYPDKEDAMETEKGEKCLSESWIMDFDMTDNVETQLANIAHLKKKKFGHFVNIVTDVADSDYVFSYLIAVEDIEDGFSVSTSVSYINKNTGDSKTVNDPEKELSGTDKELYDKITKKSKNFLEMIG